jgi:epoxyqueuosine reductase
MKMSSNLRPDLPDGLRAAAVFRQEARRRGFDRVGFARAEEPPRFAGFLSWLEQGRHAGMGYLARTAPVRADPRELLAGARSVVCLAATHDSRPFTAADGSRIARYAAGPDYHGTLRGRTLALAEAARRELAYPFAFRVCVDSTPIAERSFAAAAGLGWIGKNGCLIDRELGSYLLLAEIVTDLDLPPDDPMAERCGECTRCLDACPTSAFVEPGVLDAARCLAYWTIEHRGPIAPAMKAHVEDRVFGCDVCQEVCPWNKPLPFGEAPRRAPRRSAPTRGDWLEMGRGEWKRGWGATALNRAGRRGLQRNAAASAGSVGDSTSEPLLRQAAGSGDRGLADAAQWALERLATPTED